MDFQLSDLDIGERDRANSQSSTSSSELLSIPTNLRKSMVKKGDYDGSHLDLSSLNLNSETADYTLNWTDNQVESATSSSSFSSKVKIINLSRNCLCNLPLSVTRFSNLTSLDISENGLETLLPMTNSSSQINTIQLPSLISLNASGNKLKDNKSLGKNFGKLFASQLKVLNLSGNQFTAIPESVLEFNNLKSLYMGENQIRTLPKTLTRLHRLRFLYLGGNQLTDIPDDVGKLSKLESLSLCENKISSLPPSIANLKKLRSLYLHMNKLTTLPVEILRLNSLIELSLRDNPLVVRFVNDFLCNPPTLQELAGRVIKLNRISFTEQLLPDCLLEYLKTARRCVNPKCKGVYFDSRIEQIKFVDFCGSYHLPLMQYLCSPNCTITPSLGSDNSDEDEAKRIRIAESRIKRVLLG